MTDNPNPRAAEVLARIAEAAAPAPESVDAAPEFRSESEGCEDSRLPRPAGRYEDRDELLAAMRDYSAVLLEGGKVRIIAEHGFGYEMPSKRDAETWFASAYYAARGKRGAEITKPALNLYLSDPNRLEFTSITPDPRIPFRTPPHYTTYRGWALEPKPGKCTAMKAHLLNVICAKDQENFQHLLAIMAQLLKETGQKHNTCVVVQGPHGAGKGMAAGWLREMIGPRHSKLLSQDDQITGKFNEHLRDKFFVQVEEALWAGDRKKEGVFKSLIADETLSMEAKGGAVIDVVNFTRFWLNTNNDWAVPVAEGERRFFVLQALDPFEGKEQDDPVRRPYYDELKFEAANGGIEALMFDLLQFDYSRIDLRRPPVTTGLRAQKQASLPADQQWLHDAVILGGFTDREGDKLGRTDDWDWDQPLEISTQDLLSSFGDHVRNYNGSKPSVHQMLRALKRLGTVTQKRLTTPDGKRPPGYILPGRRAFAEHIVKVFGVEIDIPPMPKSANDRESAEADASQRRAG